MRLSTNYTLRLSWILLCLLSSLIRLNATDIECPFTIETPTYQITVSDNQYIIDFSLPPYEINDIDIEGEYPDIFHQYGQFHSIEVEADNYDVTDNIGYPELPFFPIELLLPSNSSNLRIHLEYSSIDEVELSHYIAPAIKGNTLQMTEDGEYTEIEQDEDYCAEIYQTIEQTDGFYLLSEPYDVFGTRGATLSMLPFVYHPNHNRLEVLEEGRLVIEFDGEPLSSSINRIKDMETFKSAIAMQYFEKFPWPDIPDGGRYLPRFLIVAATQDMQQELQTFVEYKDDCGYNVSLEFLEDYGALGDPNAIHSLINDKDPDYVLLIGSLEQIPPHHGSNRYYNPYSDNGYYDIIGRWIVTDNEQIETIITKTINAEQHLSFSNSAIALLSGTGMGENKVYRNIKTIASDFLSTMGVPYTIYDGRENEMDFYDFQEAAQSSSIILYRGHGGIIADDNDRVYGSYIASPYMASSYPAVGCETIDALENDNSFPIGLGIACLLNTYRTDNNFGAAWVRNEHGGVAFYGSTTVSTRDHNNNLTRKIFEVLKDKTTNNHKNLTIGHLLHTGEMKYLRAFFTPERYAATARYTLIGDPTFRIYGRASNFYSSRHRTTPRYRTDLVTNFEILSINGQIVMQGNYPIDTKTIKMLIPCGIYIVKYYQSDGECIIDKIINQ